jgi:hypothetical protein
VTPVSSKSASPHPLVRVRYVCFNLPVKTDAGSGFCYVSDIVPALRLNCVTVAPPSPFSRNLPVGTGFGYRLCNFSGIINVPPPPTKPRFIETITGDGRKHGVLRALPCRIHISALSVDNLCSVARVLSTHSLTSSDVLTGRCGRCLAMYNLCLI